MRKIIFFLISIFHLRFLVSHRGSTSWFTIFSAACLYIIIGLAILAMCFDLMKESIVEKFEWFV